MKSDVLKSARSPIIVNIMPNCCALDSRLVVALAYDGLCTFEIGVVVEVFGLPRPEMGLDWYKFAVASLDSGPLRAMGGLSVTVDGGADLLLRAGTIIVPGWRNAEELVPDAMAEIVRAAYGRGTRIVSLCSGVFVLAAAGLLSNLRATTHWRYLDLLAMRHPDIRLVPDVLYVDEGQILTAAGSAAGIDLCLHLVRSDFGPQAANSVARRLVVPPHRDGGQAQFIDRPVPHMREGARLSPLLDRLRATLDHAHTIKTMAAAAGMSARTFQRRFKATAGASPMEWLLEERLRQAREFLEATHQPVEAIAASCGFGSAATLRHHFRERLGTSPNAYRCRFTRSAA